MKKALLFALCVLTGVCARALTVSTVDGVVTVTLAQREHISNQNSADIHNAFKNADPLKIKLVGEFSSQDLNFDNYNGSKPVYLDLRDATLDANQQLGNLKDNLVELYLPTNANYTRVPDNFAQGAQYLETVHFPVNILEIGANAFDGCKNITELTLPSNVQRIEEAAFKGLSITEIVIPGTVKELGKAFWECNELTKVTFAEHLGEDRKSDVDMKIEEQAFGNDRDVWDVYVESLGKLTCDQHAFEFDVTNAQTQNARLATLHFPESKIAEYVNLNHTLDIETSKNPGLLQAWLNAHRNAAGENGWFEFVNSGPSNPEEKKTGEKFLKTFSDYNYARLVPDGVRAYIVNNVEKNEDGHYVLGLKRLLVIPARTGVILYGNITGTSLAMTPVTMSGKITINGEETDLTTDAMALVRENWANLHGEDIAYKNYLVPTSTAKGAGVYVEPYETDETGKVTFRNFGMGRFSKTESGKKYYANEGGITSDYEGFFRLKKSTIGEGKAYLRLAANEYDDPKGGEALVQKDEDFNKEYIGNSLAYSELWWKGRDWNASTTYDWGRRDANNNINKEEYFVKFKGEPVIVENGDDATLILSPETQNMDDCYFTLQGVRIQNPTQSGIYIKDGKKIYVK